MAQSWDYYDDLTTGSKTLYQSLGGIHKVAALVDTFAANMAKSVADEPDSMVKATFSAQSLPLFKYNMTSWLGQSWGGPQKYMGPDMLAWHRSAHISDRDWQMGTKAFVAAMDTNKVSMDDQKRIKTFFDGFRAKMMMPGTTEFMMPTAPANSLYSRLGGSAAISAVCEEFVNRLAASPAVTGNKQVVASLTKGKATGAGIRFLLIEQVIMATGGPAKYSGRSMADAHKGLMITEDEWVASAGIFKAVLDDFKVPAKEQGELFAIIGSTKKDVVGR